MPKFDKKYVHFMWTDILKGKKVFYGDYIGNLKSSVEEHDLSFVGTVIDTYNENYPFYMKEKEDYYSFCYYDPYYELKLAYEQGKVIQHFKTCAKVWIDVTSELGWTDNPENYRIKPEESKPVTNRELARWLAQGNGEYYEYDCDGWESHRCLEYQYEQDNLPVSNVMVRKWEDEEWHQPTRDYMGLE